jgi:hypothetical protein
MRAVYELSQYLGRPVRRLIVHSKHGAPRWYIPLDTTPYKALQEVVASHPPPPTLLHLKDVKW